MSTLGRRLRGRSFRAYAFRRGTTLSLITCAAVAISGCGLGGGSDDPVDVSGDIEGTITFQTLQLSPTFDDYINGVIADFEATNPGTTVEWTDIPSDSAARKTSADAVAGTLPDVMDLDTATLAPLGRQSLVIDMAAEASDVRDDFVESAWNSFAFGPTEVAALPWYLNTPVLIVNTAIVAEAGLAEQPAPASYQELLEVSEVIVSETGVAGFQPTEIGMPNFLLSLGVPLVTEDETAAVVDTPEAVQFVATLAELYDSGGIPTDSVTARQRSEIETFQEGQTAYLEAGGSRLGIIEENAPEVFETLAVDKPLGDAASTTWVVAHGVAVPKSSENQATALAFATFLTSAENQLALAQQSSVFPSTLASLEDPFFAAAGDDLTTAAREIAAASLREGKTVVKPAAVDTEYTAALWSAIQPAILGEVTAEEALANAETELTSILEERQQ